LSQKELLLIMKYFIILTSLSIFIQAQEKFEIYSGLKLKLASDARLAYTVHEGQMIYYKSNLVQALIVVTKIESGTAEYNARILLSNEVKEFIRHGKLKEVYERDKRVDGDVQLIDKGSDLMIDLKNEKLLWSFGEKGKCYVYREIGKFELFILDSDYYNDCEIIKHR
jgi:hypothetical protein